MIEVPLSHKRAKLKRLIRYHLQEHQRLDLMETDESAASLRLKQSIDTLSKAADKIGRFLSENEPRKGKGRTRAEDKSNITDNESAKMTTSKGTIQGYNGIAAVDKKHQIVVDAQVFGEGSEQHTLQTVIERIKKRFADLKITDNIFSAGTIVTADTGFASETNMRYLHDEKINGYIPDNQFRSRDPKFKTQKEKHKRASRAKASHQLTASEFNFDPVNLSCDCPAKKTLRLCQVREDKGGNYKAFFEGRLSACRDCELKQQCMRNPAAADHRKGHGRQVGFILSKNRKPNFTDWMKHRVDSDKGKRIYSHRMSVVEPVFGNITVNKGLKRFSLRGKTKVGAQWKLFCLIQNIEKLANYGILAS